MLKKFSRRPEHEKRQEKERDLLEAIETIDERKVLKLLRSGVPANADINTWNIQPLNKACKVGSYSIAKLLIQHGACIDAISPRSRLSIPPLGLAIEAQNTDIFNLLLNSNASVFLRFQCQYVTGEITLLQYACIRNRKQYIRALVEHGCDVNDTSSQDLCAVHYAVQFNNVDVIEELSNCRADLNITDKSGNSPLHLAVTYDSYQGAKCLVGLHVNTAAINQDGETAMLMAQKWNRDRICALLHSTQTETQHMINIDKLSKVMSDTNERISKVEAITIRIEKDMSDRIKNEVGQQVARMFRCVSRTSLGITATSEYASMEEGLEDGGEPVQLLEAGKPVAKRGTSSSYTGECIQWYWCGELKQCSLPSYFWHRCIVIDYHIALRTCFQVICIFRNAAHVRYVLYNNVLRYLCLMSTAY